MRVKGYYGISVIYILIDSGSTHNFIDAKTAARLNCEIKESGLTKVTVADGSRLGVQGRIDRFGWKFLDKKIRNRFDGHHSQRMRHGIGNSMVGNFRTNQVEFQNFGDAVLEGKSENPALRITSGFYSRS